jgi:hypothetical protein
MAKSELQITFVDEGNVAPSTQGAPAPGPSTVGPPQTTAGPGGIRLPNVLGAAGLQEQEASEIFRSALDRVLNALGLGRIAQAVNQVVSRFQALGAAIPASQGPQGPPTTPPAVQTGPSDQPDAQRDTQNLTLGADQAQTGIDPGDSPLALEPGPPPDTTEQPLQNVTSGPPPVQTIAPIVRMVDTGGAGPPAAPVGAGFGPAPGAGAAAAMSSLATGATVAAAAFAAIAAAVAASVMVVRQFSETMTEETRKIEGWSPDVSMALGAQQIQGEMTMMERSEAIGPQLAEFTNLQTEWQRATGKLWTEILKVLLDMMVEAKPAIKAVIASTEVLVGGVPPMVAALKVIVDIMRSDLAAVIDDGRKLDAAALAFYTRATTAIAKYMAEDDMPAFFIDPLLDEFLKSAGVIPLTPPPPDPGEKP